MRKKSLVITILVASFAIAAAAGCKKDQSTTGADAKQAMGLYAKGYNALIADPKRLITGYFSSIPDGPKDLDAKRASRPSLSSASFADSKIKEARDAFAAAETAAPESLAGLSPAAKTALTATEKALAVYDTAYKYYEAESFKDDKGAKGKELHAQMIAVRKEFNGALGKLSDGMESIEDAQVADEIKKYADDKDYSYWFRFYNQQSKQVVVAVTRAETPADVAKLPAAVKALAPADEQLAAFVAKKGSALSSSFKNYSDNAVTFQAEAKKLVRLIEAGKTFEDQELGQAADAVVSAFNNLISMGNALYQVEAVNNLKDQ